MKTTLVVAGNRAEFKSFIADKIQEQSSPSLGPTVCHSMNEIRIDDHRYIYISQPEYMRGFHGVDVVFYGTFFNRSPEEIDKFQNLAQIARIP